MEAVREGAERDRTVVVNRERADRRRAVARTVKDLICRHRAMKGFYVPRKAGWDTHGLPVRGIDQSP